MRGYQKQRGVAAKGRLRERGRKGRLDQRGEKRTRWKDFKGCLGKGELMVGI